MTRRVLDKNILEIRGTTHSAFHNTNPFTSDECQGFSSESSSMGGDLSPVSDILSPVRHKTEILWSQEKDDLFLFDRECIAESNWSEATGRTLSSCSWGDDEFERESTDKVKSLLNAIDEALYEEIKQPYLDQELFEECQKWATKYPYLRIKGEQIVEPVDDSVIFFPTVQEKGVLKLSHDLDDSSQGLMIEGKKMPIYHTTNSEERAIFQNECIDSLGSILSEDVPDYIEEIIEQDGEYEEFLVYDKSVDCDKEECPDNPSTPKLNSSVIGDIKEKVIQRLTNKIWPEESLENEMTAQNLFNENKVKSLLQSFEENKFKTGTSALAGTSAIAPSDPVTRKSCNKQDSLLPPIIVPSEYSRPLSQLRPNTGHRSPLVSPDFPSLDGILTVSSKVLQKKREYRTGSESEMRTRPNSGVLLHSKSPELNHSSLPTYNQQTPSKYLFQPVNMCEIPENSNSSFGKGKKNAAREFDVLGLYMPVLEEDSTSLPDILRGIHVEPEVRESTSQQSKISDISHNSVKSQFFLPPIKDNESTSVNNKQNQQFSPSESRLNSGVNRNRSNVFGRYLNKSNSRPSTSRSFRGTSGHLLNRQKSVAGDTSSQFNGFGYKLKSPISPNQQNFSSLPVTENKDFTVLNAKKSVTLFPLVTSLGPGRENNNAKAKGQHSVKRGGLFGAFTSGNRR